LNVAAGHDELLVVLPGELKSRSNQHSGNALAAVLHRNKSVNQVQPSSTGATILEKTLSAFVLDDESLPLLVVSHAAGELLLHGSYP
jgi:hypothetical protein